MRSDMYNTQWYDLGGPTGFYEHRRLEEADIPWEERSGNWGQSSPEGWLHWTKLRRCIATYNKEKNLWGRPTEEDQRMFQENYPNSTIEHLDDVDAEN